LCDFLSFVTLILPQMDALFYSLTRWKQYFVKI